MNKLGPIIVIEDDADDQEFLDIIFKNLNYTNEIIYFAQAELALEYLIATSIRPFLILSDINMPRVNGFELREEIQKLKHLDINCTPYIFLTSAVSEKTMMNAYSKSIQGFFVKPNNCVDLEQRIKRIVDYWKDCISPVCSRA